jgi:hypothetical protein
MVNFLNIEVEELYHALIKAGLSDEEIKREMADQFNKFHGFMTKEALLFLIAKEHGLGIGAFKNKFDLSNKNEDLIDYNDFLINIENITEGMNNLVIIGKITTIFYCREFVRKDGSLGKVGSFIINDNTGKIKVTLWNEKCAIFSNDIFKVGEVVQVIGAYSKLGLNGEIEVHLNRKGKVRLSTKHLVI